MVILTVPFVSFILFWFHSETYCWFYPSIDTRYAPNYSERKFDSIQIGMTTNQLTELLGPPLYQMDKPLTKVSKWCYSDDGACWFGDFAWLGRSVIVSNGVIVSIGKTIFYD